MPRCWKRRSSRCTAWWSSNRTACTTSRWDNRSPSVSATTRACSTRSRRRRWSRSPGSATSSARPSSLTGSVWSTWAAAPGWMPATPCSWSGPEDGWSGSTSPLSKWLGPGASRGRRAGPGRVPRRRDREHPGQRRQRRLVISNGVVNLSPDKAAVFTEAASVLRPGGRLAIADIVRQRQLKHTIVCDPDLWAACIGGAAQQDAYQELIENTGLAVTTIRRNDYEFISQRAGDASAKYGVKSISLLAVKSSG